MGPDSRSPDSATHTHSAGSKLERKSAKYCGRSKAAVASTTSGSPGKGVWLGKGRDEAVTSAARAEVGTAKGRRGGAAPLGRELESSFSLTESVWLREGTCVSCLSLRIKPKPRPTDVWEQGQGERLSFVFRIHSCIRPTLTEPESSEISDPVLLQYKGKMIKRVKAS
nr:uncharacterized protein LOC112428091 [Macaca nemestrina]